MRRFIYWLESWAVTLKIMIFEPRTYRYLVRWQEFREDDFIEVKEPEA